VVLRFYGNLTQSQIARQIGVSQMHVSRLLSRALTKLRGHLTDTDEPPMSRAS
jgi:RNA polymerase sigma-B factor